MATPSAPTADAVVEGEAAVEDHLVAVEAPDRQLVGLDRDGLGVGAGGDEDQVAGGGGVDRGLDRLVVLGDPQRGAAEVSSAALPLPSSLLASSSSPPQAAVGLAAASTAPIARRAVGMVGSPKRVVMSVS